MVLSLVSIRRNKKLHIFIQNQDNIQLKCYKNVYNNIPFYITKKYYLILIGQTNDVRYDVTYFPAFCSTKPHFRWSEKLVVDTSILT